MHPFGERKAMTWETQFQYWPIAGRRDSRNHRSAKLTPRIVAELRRIHSTGTVSYRALARYTLTTYGIHISRQAIERAVQGYTWKAVTVPDNGAE